MARKREVIGEDVSVPVYAQHGCLCACAEPDCACAHQDPFSPEPPELPPYTSTEEALHDVVAAMRSLPWSSPVPGPLVEAIYRAETFLQTHYRED